MIQAVIYCIVTVILTKELVIATDQCTEYQFKSPFYPGVSCEDIYNKNSQSHDRPGYYWITDGPSRVYCGMTYTGSSCEDIYDNNPETASRSGYYRINDTQWTYCNMTTIANGLISTCAGVGGGWTRIAHFNISAGDDCPAGWNKDTQSGISFCRPPGSDPAGYLCYSTIFSTNGASYSRVCGRARGYQKGQVWGFWGSTTAQGNTIDGSYVDGISITHGAVPRQHIWTYAVGYYDGSASYTCPCRPYQSTLPPSYINNNYFCESGATSAPITSTYYFSDPLWDGSGCSSNNNCCSITPQPWFNCNLK